MDVHRQHGPPAGPKVANPRRHPLGTPLGTPLRRRRRRRCGDGDKGDKSYGGKRGEVWIFGGCDESGVLDDVWRYDVDTCVWHPTRVARPGRRSAGRLAADGVGQGAAAAAGAEKKNVAWPPGRFGHAVVVVPARELDPTAAARLHVADESPCAVIHGGCGAGGEVLNDVWAFSF